MIKPKQSGFSLIEVVVTMFIMSVGLLGLAGLQSTAVKDGLGIATRSQVTWLVTELVERIRANPGGLASYERTINIAACGAAPFSCSDSDNVTNATACDADQIAQFDVWEVFCGQPAPAAGVLTNSPDSLNLDSVTITCIGGVCNDFVNLSVDISWTSNTVKNNRSLTAAAVAAHQSRSISMTVRP
jgi:type IV pilus assembly protein PilV